MELSGYSLCNILNKSRKNITWQGLRNSDQKKVVIKTPSQQISSLEDDLSIKYEFEILQQLQCEKLLSPIELISYEGKPVLIREYAEGESLKDYLQKNLFSLREFLVIAIQLCEIIEQVHQHKIIHKDINPSNIIYHESLNECKLIDFEIAVRADHISQNKEKPGYFEGTLPYLSPEQTGRINRSVDYRSDLYSLGVTYYEILTGQLPFTMKDPLAIIHAHIAKTPDSPVSVRNDTPPALSDIILKLLSKNTTDRYQSVSGLKYDLIEVFKSVQTGKEKDSFEIGTRDFSQHFIISQQLYGRTKEINTLNKLFYKTYSGKKNLLLISGEAGVGKSALVAEMYKLMALNEGFFLEGKFDQLQRNIPYYAWQQVFDRLAEILLSEDPADLLQWKNKIQNALGNNARIITEISTGFKLLLDTQSELQVLDLDANQNRFNFTFKKLISVLTEEGHPLIIFIDDWQWADIPSVKLLENILLDIDSAHMLLICASRINETDDNHPFEIGLKGIKEALADFQQIPVPEIEEIKISNLKLEDIKELLSDSLRTSSENISSLAKVLYKKTDGNAYFIIQKLQYLYNKKLIVLDIPPSNQCSWKWNIDEIKKIDISDNVIDFILSKYRCLSLDTQEILKIASCIGNHFHLNMLTIVCGHSPQKIFKCLLEASMENFIEHGQGKNILQFRFVHDRVRQALYESGNADEFKTIHYKIAEELEKAVTKEELSVRIFEIADQYNYAISLVEQSDKRHQVATLNLIASQKAMASTAYNPALAYATTAIHLMAEESWEHHYTLMYELHKIILECTYLIGNFHQTDFWIDIILKHVKGLSDITNIYEIQIDIFQSQNKLQAILELGIKILNSWGYKIYIPGQADTIIQSIKSKYKLKNPVRFTLLPFTENEKAVSMERIIFAIGPAVYFTQPNLSVILGTRRIQSLLKNGETPYTAVSYVYFIQFMAYFNDVERTCQYGELAQKLKLHLPNLNSQQKVEYFYHIYVQFWKISLEKVSENLKTLYYNCIETGNFVYGGLSAALSIYYAFYAGQSLRAIHPVAAQYEIDLRKKIKNEGRFNGLMTICIPIAYFTGNEESLRMYNGDHYEEQKLLDIWSETNNQSDITCFYIGKIYYAYLLGNIEEGYAYYQKIKNNLPFIAGTVMVQFFHFIHALIFSAICTDMKGIHKYTFKRKIIQSENMFLKWSALSPENFSQKYYLIKAERHRICYEDKEAVRYYLLAIQKAKENHHLADEALSYELMAKFYLSQNLAMLAGFFLQNAYQVYEKWGAITKCQQLINTYPAFINAFGIPDTYETITGITASRKAQMLDMMSVIKNSQAISREIELEKLLKGMLEVVMENAGAERGIFLLYDDLQQLRIQAEIDLPKQHKQFLQNIIADENISDTLPENIIHYVARTLKTVILDEAKEDRYFSQNKYISANEIRSVLCMPLIKQSKTIGILYLENNLSSNTFVSERLEIIKLLSSQMAISLENALLYESLERKVRLRTKEVIEQKEEISLQRDKLNVALNKLQELDTFKVKIVNMIAHDLKNPLNTIMGLSDGNFNLSTQKHIMQASTHMLNLIHNMLDVHKFEEIKLQPICRPNLIDVLVKESINHLVWFSQTKWITIRSAFDAGLYVDADKELITRVLVNLLNNAIKYSPEQGEITISGEVKHSYIKIMVTDSGPGIVEVEQTKIFDQYYQSPAQKPGISHSTGLGLAFCKLAIEAHGGEIGIFSDPNKGCTFWFTLKLAGTTDSSLLYSYQPDTAEYQENGKKKYMLLLTEKDKIYLAPWLNELRTYQINQLSHVKKVLGKIDTQNEISISQWKEELQMALYTCDQKKYEMLIDL